MLCVLQVQGSESFPDAPDKLMKATIKCHLKQCKFHSHKCTRFNSYAIMFQIQNMYPHASHLNAGVASPWTRHQTKYSQMGSIKHVRLHLYL